MSTYALYSISQETILKSGLAYPNADPDSPVIGLDPDLRLIPQTDGAQPSYDPETHRLAVTNVLDLEGNEYRREYSLEELPPVPNWDEFNAALLTNPEFIAYQQAIGHPIASAVLDAYALVATNGVGAFTQIFNLFCHLGSVDPDHRTAWADTAASLNLPADFSEVIRG